MCLLILHESLTDTLHISYKKSTIFVLPDCVKSSFIITLVCLAVYFTIFFNSLSNTTTTGFHEKQNKQQHEALASDRTTT